MNEVLNVLKSQLHNAEYSLPKVESTLVQYKDSVESIEYNITQLKTKIEELKKAINILEAVQ